MIRRPGKKGTEMLKRYLINGKEWQYEEGEQPAGAVELYPETDCAEEDAAGLESEQDESTDPEQEEDAEPEQGESPEPEQKQAEAPKNKAVSVSRNKTKGNKK